ncbi:arsenate reductase family protein [Terribacillus sp. DMT04]|uniref:arsenate reductase family protein n=1 Tax=Terribacillus sp. DMT04 TaxID=2850441 RepID=UPI001C2B7DDB|nr:arsenate reductase family protein [Terribacillus sp. DMT04]QXE00822.1 arsenate reductase family protein [Terribacillus sp. DMT04]
MFRFYWYPNCSTCKNAKKWLEEHQIPYEAIHIVETPPSPEELQEAADKSGLPLTKLFNTSGKVYREGGYKDKIKEADDAQLKAWLSENGMLIKRPLLIGENQAAVGFKPEVYTSVTAAN